MNRTKEKDRSRKIRPFFLFFSLVVLLSPHFPVTCRAAGLAVNEASAILQDGRSSFVPSGLPQISSGDQSTKVVDKQYPQENLEESERKEREIVLLKREQAIRERELKRHIFIKYLFVSGSILLVLVALFLYNRYRLKMKAHRELQLAHEEIKEKNEALEEAYREKEIIARKDALTGLSNRRHVMEKILDEQTRFERSGQPFSLVLIDIDDFKKINDRHGHDYGDLVLATVSGIMKSMIRKQDVLGRWGGEEFMLLLPNTNLEGGRILSEKIRDRFSSSAFILHNEEVCLTLTFGVAIYDRLIDIDMCIKQADNALYKGKKRGKDCVMTAEAEPLIRIQ